MMPGGIAVRAIRIEEGARSEKEVKQMRARDIILSKFNEDRAEEVF